MRIDNRGTILQIALEKARAYESYYALSQFPDGWSGEQVELYPVEIAALVEAGLVRRVRDDYGRLVDVGPGEDCTSYLGGYYYQHQGHLSGSS